MFIFVFSAEAPAFQVLPSLKRLKQRIIAAGRGQYDAVFMSGRYGDQKCFWTSISNSEFCISSARFVPGNAVSISCHTIVSLSLSLQYCYYLYLSFFEQHHLSTLYTNRNSTQPPSKVDLMDQNLCPQSNSIYLFQWSGQRFLSPVRNLIWDCVLDSLDFILLDTVNSFLLSIFDAVVALLLVSVPQTLHSLSMMTMNMRMSFCQVRLM